jgi:hypothetical protein
MEMENVLAGAECQQFKDFGGLCRASMQVLTAAIV